MSKTVFITGGTGFIGEHLVRALLGKGARVKVLVHISHIPQTIKVPQVEFIRGDILKPESFAGALSDVSEVYHLAGKLHLPGISAHEYHRLHVEGTENLLKACLKTDSLDTIVHCSTTGVLGPTGSIAANEDTPYNPKTIYEQSKAQGEKLALNYARQYNLPLKVIRPSLVYGPGDLHLLGWYRAIQKRVYRVVGSGENLLHPIYIDDLITGIIQAAQTPSSPGTVYHLVGADPLSIKEMASAMALALNRPLGQSHLPLPLARLTAAMLQAIPGLRASQLPLTHARIDFMTESRIYSGELAKKKLGFQPETNLQTGLKKTVNWYMEQGLL